MRIEEAPGAPGREWRATILSLIPLICVAGAALAEEEIPVLSVTGQRIATTTPASTYATPVSLLELDPRIDLQVRNIAEAQGDVTLRGGIFENTGFNIGGLTLFDPQTGHYSAEIPVAGEMLTTPAVLTGAANSIFGFNSTVGTVAYDWAPVRAGGSLTAGLGNHGSHYQRAHAAHLTGERGDPVRWGIEGDLSRSKSDGTTAFGDHDFSRRNLRVQVQRPTSRTDLFAGEQKKFFGWFGMYTGAAYAAFNPFETEDLRTRLVLLNHQRTYAAGSRLRVGLYARHNEDHYIFNRFAPNRAFVHETSVSALAVDGSHRLAARTSDSLALEYSGQVLSDRIESTTLENSFTERRYVKVGIMPRLVRQLSSGDEMEVSVGLAYADTDRDASTWLPALELARVFRGARYTPRVHLSYSESSQLPGYTAVGGPAGGLFASNAALGVEQSSTLELGVTMAAGGWQIEAALFERRDRDLVDWTYAAGLPNARTANAVDIDVSGFELLTAKQWRSLELLASYAWLDKEEDYGAATVGGSFYALNHARHRVTAAVIWDPTAWMELRVDNEWRDQRESAIRAGSDRALFTHLLLTFRLPRVEALLLSVAAENVWDDDFEEVPGTPGRGRQVTAALSWSW